jgi:hypothetical protein
MRLTAKMPHHNHFDLSMWQKIIPIPNALLLGHKTHWRQLEEI